MLRATLKNLAARKLRLLTTAVSVLLGVAFMAGTMVLTDTVTKTFDDLFANVNKGVDAQVRSASKVTTGDMSQRARVDESLVTAVKAVDGVRDASGDVLGYTQIVGKDGKAIGNPGRGAPTYGTSWNDNPAFNAFHLVAGRSPAAPDEVVIDQLSADRGKLHVGDTTTLLVNGPPVHVTVVGISKFGSADSPGGASIVQFTPAEAQRLAAAPGKYDSVSVQAAKGVSQAELQKRLRAVLPSDVEVKTGAQIVKEQQDAMRKGLAFFGTFMLAFALIALFVGAFIIYNTFSIIVAQRTREMALLRAIGASRRQVTASIVAESAIVGVIASVLGVLVGIGVAVGLKSLLRLLGVDVPASGLVLHAGTVVVSMLVGVGVCVVSAVVPARRGARVAPVAAMRDVAVEPRGRTGVRALIGGLIGGLGVLSLGLGLFSSTRSAGAVGAGAFLVLIGVAVLGPIIARPIASVLGWPLPALRGMTGTLARENAVRNPRRTSATAAALMIGVAVVGFFTIFASSAKAEINTVIDRQFKGDFVIDSGSTAMGGLDPSLFSRIASAPGVGAAASVRLGAVELDGKGTMVAAIDPAAISRIFDIGVVKGDLLRLGTDGVAVDDKTAAKDHLSIGSTIPVHFAGHPVMPFQVVAIYTQRELAGSHLFSQAAWKANVADQFDYQIYVKKAAGSSTAALRSALDAAAAPYPTAKVEDMTEYKQSQVSQINQMLGLIYVLLMLAIVIALMGIANTLALSIHERTRELGLLRAVGMTRGQLRSSVRWESVIIALFGTVLGLGVGVFFGWSMVKALADQGFSTFRVPVGQLGVIAVLAALCGVVAAVLPAYRAGKLDVLRAIATD